MINEFEQNNKWWLSDFSKRLSVVLKQLKNQDSTQIVNAKTTLKLIKELVNLQRELIVNNYRKSSNVFLFNDCVVDITRTFNVFAKECESSWQDAAAEHQALRDRPAQLAQLSRALANAHTAINQAGDKITINDKLAMPFLMGFTQLIDSNFVQEGIEQAVNPYEEGAKIPGMLFAVYDKVATAFMTVIVTVIEQIPPLRKAADNYCQKQDAKWAQFWSQESQESDEAEEEYLQSLPKGIRTAVQNPVKSIA